MPAVPPRAKAEPQKLSGRVLALVSVLLPVFLAVFTIGAAGLIILTDTDGKYAISQSFAAEQYKKLIQMNPFFSAIFVNGGMIGTLFCISRLHGHRQACTIERLAAQKQQKSKKSQ